MDKMPEGLNPQTPPEPEQEDKPRPAAPLPSAVGGMVGGTVRAVYRGVLAVLGAFFIIMGVPLAVITPFPFVPIGLPVVILGVVLLGRNSDFGRRWMEGIMQRYPKVERFAPNWLMKLVFGRPKRAMMEEARVEAAIEALENPSEPEAGKDATDQDTTSR
jgi:hypothetical protein